MLVPIGPFWWKLEYRARYQCQKSRL
jgi:hypothetical protein